MKKLIALATLAAFCICAIAQNTDNYPAHYGHANPAIKQYVKEHIMPVILQKRQLVEKELTTAEKSELATDRTAIKQLFAQRKEQLQQKPAGVSMRDFMHSDEQRAFEKQSHQQMKQIMASAQSIANNHLATLDNIHGQLEPSRQQWKDDINKLRASANTQSVNAQNVNAQSRSAHPGMKGGMGDHLFNGEKAYAHFLLLPAQATAASATDDLGNIESLMTEEPATSGATSLNGFQVLPNPATNELITSNGQLPGSNEFKLTDMQGRVALSLQNVQPAQHIDISQLASGTYLVQLTGNGQSQQSKVVISH